MLFIIIACSVVGLILVLTDGFKSFKKNQIKNDRFSKFNPVNEVKKENTLFTKFWGKSRH